MAREEPSRGTSVRRGARGTLLASHEVELTIEEPGRPRRTVTSSRTRTLIGTDPSCDVVLVDPMVSRRHCEIEGRDDRFVITDVGSTNGTEVNDVVTGQASIYGAARLRLGETVVSIVPRVKWTPVPPSESDRFGELRGSTPAMRELFALLERVAATELSVVVHGETGTGKDVVARSLHAASARARGPFVVLDAAALPPSLAESELFGHERGAFTGADRARAGVFEAAHGGTLFVDELAELPLALQPKLLRALEQREVVRLGARAPTRFDVRVIAATHRDLLQQVRAGRFREDLYYRLAEIVLEVPPLRARIDDLPLLVRALGENETAARALSPGALAALAGHSWPGNVRELRNVVRRLVALSRGAEVSEIDARLALAAGKRASSPPAASAPDARADVAPPSDAPAAAGPLPTLEEAREAWNRQHEETYLRALVARHRSLREASAAAAVHPKSLERLLRRHGIRLRDRRPT